jgi:Ser/Thr protein kinase RdoA (MazF antagonist)
MGIALGRFHDLTAQSGITGWWWDYDPTFRFPVDFLDYRRRTLAEAEISRTHRARVEACLNDMGDMLTDAIRQLTDAGWNELPHIPIHGDFGHHNCRFTGVELAAVVDFGMTRMSPRSLDISKGLGTALGPGADDHFPGWERARLEMPDREAVVGWLECYMRFAPPFDEKEARLLPLVCAANWTTWGHPPMDEERVESCGLVADFMRSLLRDSWDIYSIVRPRGR